MPNPERTEYLSTAEVAELVGVDKSTINRWEQRGVISPIVRGPGLRGAKLFRRSDIEALASERRAG